MEFPKGITCAPEGMLLIHPFCIARIKCVNRLIIDDNTIFIPSSAGLPTKGFQLNVSRIGKQLTVNH